MIPFLITITVISLIITSINIIIMRRNEKARDKIAELSGLNYYRK